MFPIIEKPNQINKTLTVNINSLFIDKFIVNSINATNHYSAARNELEFEEAEGVFHKQSKFSSRQYS